MFRKNKKKKSLGYIIVRMTLSTLTKEEYNEVNFNLFNNIMLGWTFGCGSIFLCKYALLI